MLDNIIIQELKAYIEAHYELVSKPFPTSRIPLRQGADRPSFKDLFQDLSEFLKNNPETEKFSERLEKLRIERGIDPPKLYKDAWIDKKVYSKIKNNPHYQPSKHTVIAFGLSLKLTLADMTELLETAGFALSKSSIFDLIIMFCLEKPMPIYDLHDVNALLHQSGQKVLCSEPR